MKNTPPIQSVTTAQKIAVATLATLFLGAGVFLAGVYGNFSMKSEGVLYSFSQSTAGLQGSKPSEIVELKNGDTYDLTASYVAKTLADKKQTMLAYNGMIPGPEIHVAQGAEVTINFKNDTDLPTLLHSHGVRMDNAFDGSQLQQKEIQPGQSFSYKLKFPDAGVYWYHPHASEVYGQALGLYGAFVVAPADSSYYPKVNREEVIFLSDIPINNGSIALSKDDKDHVLMGHFGNTLLINGQENYSLAAKTGEIVRLAIVNAANARPFNFAIAGTKLKLVGGDSGAYEKASWQNSVTLGPSERAIVDVLFDTSGTYEMQNKTPDKTYALGKVVVSNEAVETSYQSDFDTLQESKAVMASIDPFRPYFSKPAEKKLMLVADMMGMTGMGGHMMPDGTMMGGSMGGMGMVPAGGIEWEDSDMAAMNAMSTTDSVTWNIVDQATGKKGMDIDWTFKRGQPVVIEIYNDPNSTHPMQHPIHFHGQRFLVVSRDGVPQTNLVWKDTVLVKAGEKVRIVLDPSNPGEWMAHCHISEHLVAGMMFTYRIE